MERPVIGICGAVEHARWTVWDQAAVLTPLAYVTAVQRAGGLALIIPPDPEHGEHPRQALELLDGLMLAGGADIDPAGYGAQPHPATVGADAVRDRVEIALANAAIDLDLPLLGICRGMQLLNVARGGTLHQHLPDLHGHERHRPNPGSFDDSEHDVRLQPGSLVARIVGAGRSPHHAAPPSGHRHGRR